MSDQKIIFSMSRVSKIYPPNKQVIKNINLSFFYGAKIGVLGLNGAGKSTLLKIIAGIDKEYQGEVVMSEGYSVGYLYQHPELDPEKTVKEVVSEGAKEVVDALKEFEEINKMWENPMSDDEMNKLIERQGKVQERIEALDGWNLDHRLEYAMDALRTPPGKRQPMPMIASGSRRERSSSSTRAFSRRCSSKALFIGDNPSMRSESFPISTAFRVVFHIFHQQGFRLGIGELFNFIKQIRLAFLIFL